TFSDVRDDLFLDESANSDGYAGYILALVYGPDFTRNDWNIVHTVLTDGGRRAIELSSPDAEHRLRVALLAAFALPQFHLQ
ncbi:MAG: hypothetical protein RLW62_04460, partial [Gammaproteobacteria bacterium]